MLENAITTITKKYAMTIGSKSCIEGIQFKTINISYVIIVSGMWPFYFPAIQRHLNLFKDGGIILSEKNPTWIRCHETVQTEVLSLTP